MTRAHLTGHRFNHKEECMPIKTKDPAPVTEQLTASEAAALIFQHHFEYLLSWEETAKTWDDIEGVHQVRVSFRKIRSALTLFRNAIPKAVSAPWNQEIRWIAGEMGMARDLAGDPLDRRRDGHGP